MNPFDAEAPVATGQGGPGALAPGPEFNRIRGFLKGARRAAPGVVVGPGDDCAVVAGAGIALSSDLSVEEVHFRRAWLTPRQIGYRAASAALSDLAAVAARPIGVLASLAVPRGEADETAREVMLGVREAVEGVGGVLLGGDLTASPGPLAIDVTVVGEVAEAVLRSGARAGDEVWVTGTLGAAALCVRRLLCGAAAPEAALHRFAAPRARTAEALWLRERGIVRAMLDLSDGLAGDAAHLAAASGVAIVLDAAAVPVHPAVRAELPDAEALELAVSGGEDYELCFAAAPGAAGACAAEFAEKFGVEMTRVGVVEAGAGVHWAVPGGGRAAVAQRGFQHFGEGA